MSRVRAKPVGAALMALLLGAVWAASVGIQVAIDRRLAPYRDVPQVLWIPSGKLLKKLSLGTDGLMADLYWTRAVQYYGGQIRDRKTDFGMLGPLLDITVDLDPYLLVAYRFGALFLAEPPPRGAGQPVLAVRLLRKGIQANPDQWRLWHDLGFIYYWDLKDYSAAAAAYLQGSQNPRAAPWMKVMAAVIMEKGGNRETTRFLWTEIYQSAEDPTIRQNALDHLQGLKAMEDIENLEERINLYHNKTGRWPQSFSELVAKGLLRGIPLDPLGFPYQLHPGGKVSLDAKSTSRLEGGPATP